MKEVYNKFVQFSENYLKDIAMLILKINISLCIFSSCNDEMGRHG
ncbi:MAG: hypothetical protein ACI8ZX_000325 [Planctomycetota bacterium]|jgi:hypothetical protein